MEKENFNKLKTFFDYDDRVQCLIKSIIPLREVLNDPMGKVVYREKLDKALEEMEYYLYYMANNFCPMYLSCLKRLLAKIVNDFKANIFNVEGTRKVYIEEILEMRNKFLVSLGEGLKGYTPFYGDGVLEPVSINEYLHLLHWYVQNNSEIYRSVPQLDFVSTRDTHLLGEEDVMARAIAESLEDASIIPGRIDIIGLNDRILIMARNIGHALTVGITYENGYAFADYFIPKICNLEMVNVLPGRLKAKEGDIFARGNFRTIQGEMPEALKEFMEKVPTDLDIVQPVSMRM